MDRHTVALRGRERELAVLASVLHRPARGQSGVLLITGEAGIGKSALVDAAVRAAPDELRIERATAAESEMALPYAGLHQLTAGLADESSTLPTPQRAALDAAFGRSGDDESPNPFLVGLAVLGLLVQASARQPLACVVDDAHWLDAQSAQVLAFVARRLAAERVALILAVRTADGEVEGLPELAMEGLAEADALALFAHALPGAVDERVRDQLLAESRGNPLALLELPRALTAAEFGSAHTGRPAPLVERIEDSLLAQVRALPEPAQRLLVVAAAEPTGDPVLLRRAADALELGTEAFDAAVSAEALTVGARFELRHPLVRSAVYRAAPAEERRRVHAALADATDPEIDPDRRAWHRAQATVSPDETVAADLERSAGRARRRGGAGAAAAFLERAAALTPDRERATVRLVAAAQAMQDAGAPQDALRLLAAAPDDALPPREAALAAALRARARYALDRDATIAPALVAAAQRLAPLDAAAAREAYLDAFSVARYAGRVAQAVEPDASPAISLADVGHAVLEATRDETPERPLDLVLQGQARIAVRDYAGGVPLLRRAFAAYDPRTARSADLPWILRACQEAFDIWDLDALRTLSAAQVELARAGGVLAALPNALNLRGVALLQDGDLDAAAVVADEIELIKQVTRQSFPANVHVVVAAWRGREAVAQPLIAELRAGALARREGLALSIADFAEAILFNGLGRHAEALAASRHQLPYAGELRVTMRAMTELVEAAVHVGEHAVAEQALAQLQSISEPLGGRWLGGELELATALVAGEDDAAEAHYLAAVEQLDASGLFLVAGRARLCFGEWLRRRRRRIDAREQLTEAERRFTARGAEAFAARAARELTSTGAKARPRIPGASDALTPQELNVARMARDGLTNREIATRLFVSDRTVEYHLRKVYGKLGITSRRALADAL